MKISRFDFPAVRLRRRSCNACNSHLFSEKIPRQPQFPFIMGVSGTIKSRLSDQLNRPLFGLGHGPTDSRKT